MTDRQIVAGSGGFLFDYPRLAVGPMLHYAFELTGEERPNYCLIATANGDDAKYIANFYDACSRVSVNPSHLQLFPMPNHDDIEKFIMSQDVIWVAGGSVANLLALWRLHGLDDILRRAWEAGIILTGQSAGSICWNIGGTTDSFGKGLRPVTDGLGLLPYSSGVHYNTEAQRRPLFQKLIADGELPDGYATDDGVNLHFIGTELHEAVSDRPDVFAYRVWKAEDGSVQEEVITPRLLS